MSAAFPFLTLEDPRARIKGSRDPLGLVPIWTAFGRRLVANLTTVSASVRGFSTLLLGRYLGERLYQEEKIRDDDVLPLFQRTEQIVAYVRHVAYDAGDDIRGIERVRRRSAESKAGGVPIGIRSGETILSDQKTYGLWGLFTSPARTSGLVREGPIGLTEEARAFVEATYWPKLAAAERELLTLVRKGGPLPLKRSHPVFGAVAKAFPEPVSNREVPFWAEWLRDAEHAEQKAAGRQARLRSLLQSRSDLEAPVDRAELETIARAADTMDEGLARAIRDVLDLEALLVPADLAFRLVLARNRARIADVARALRDRWGESIPHLRVARIEEILPRIRDAQDDEIAALAKRLAVAFDAAAYDEVIATLLDWNRAVMDRRKAAPWVVRADGGRLDVRFEEGERDLPDGDELASTWHNSYFLDALKRVTLQLERAS